MITAVNPCSETGALREGVSGALPETSVKATHSASVHVFYPEDKIGIYDKKLFHGSWLFLERIGFVQRSFCKDPKCFFKIVTESIWIVYILRHISYHNHGSISEWVTGTQREESNLYNSLVVLILNSKKQYGNTLRQNEMVII